MKVRVGLIGCGIISKRHVDGYLAIPDRVEIVAVADREEDRACAAAQPHTARYYTDYRPLLADPDVDAVDVCLPHHLHREVTVAALEAGKHVLCEKPIAPSLAEADAMIAAAERAGRVLMVGENYRFLPEVARARELLAEGVIGEPTLIQSTFAAWMGGIYMDTAWRFVADEVGGGVLLDSGIHYVDVLVALMGQPKTVSCLTKRVRDFFPAEDLALVAVQFANGALGELTAGWSLRHLPELLFRVCGTEGTLTARRGQIEVSSERLPQRPTLYDLPKTTGFPEEIAHFVECVAEGKRPLMGGAEARADLQFVLAAYESARTGRHVEV